MHTIKLFSSWLQNHADISQPIPKAFSTVIPMMWKFHSIQKSLQNQTWSRHVFICTFYWGRVSLQCYTGSVYTKSAHIINIHDMQQCKALTSTTFKPWFSVKPVGAATVFSSATNLLCSIRFLSGIGNYLTSSIYTEKQQQACNAFEKTG